MQYFVVFFQLPQLMQLPKASFLAILTDALFSFFFHFSLQCAYVVNFPRNTNIATLFSAKLPLIASVHPYRCGNFGGTSCTQTGTGVPAKEEKIVSECHLLA